MEEAGEVEMKDVEEAKSSSRAADREHEGKEEAKMELDEV